MLTNNSLPSHRAVGTPQRDSEIDRPTDWLNDGTGWDVAFLGTSSLLWPYSSLISCRFIPTRDSTSSFTSDSDHVTVRSRLPNNVNRQRQRWATWKKITLIVVERKRIAQRWPKNQLTYSVWPRPSTAVDDPLVTINGQPDVYSRSWVDWSANVIVGESLSAVWTSMASSDIGESESGVALPSSRELQRLLTVYRLADRKIPSDESSRRLRCDMWIPRFIACRLGV